MSYRLEIHLANEGWHYRGTYKTAKRAYEQGQALISRGETSMHYQNLVDYRVFKLDSKGSYGSFDKVSFVPVMDEQIILATLTNGTKLEAWLYGQP